MTGSVQLLCVPIRASAKTSLQVGLSVVPIGYIMQYREMLHEEVKHLLGLLIALSPAKAQPSRGRLGPFCSEFSVTALMEDQLTPSSLGLYPFFI